MKFCIAILALCTISAFAQTSVQAQKNLDAFQVKYRALKAQMHAETNPAKKGALKVQVGNAKVQRWELLVAKIKAEDAENTAMQKKLAGVTK
jgi:hypothetical protein